MAHPAIRAAVQIITSAVLLLVALIAYDIYAETTAERRANAFCNSLKVGDSADAVFERAKTSGADERRTRWISPPNQDRWLPVTYTGFTPISRHICSITATTVVTSFKYVYLD